jgi:hypothetical protein
MIQNPRPLKWNLQLFLMSREPLFGGGVPCDQQCVGMAGAATHEPSTREA